MVIGNNVIEDHAKMIPGISHTPDGFICNVTTAIQITTNIEIKEPEKTKNVLLYGMIFNAANTIAVNIPHNKYIGVNLITEPIIHPLYGWIFSSKVGPNIYQSTKVLSTRLKLIIFPIPLYS